MKDRWLKALCATFAFAFAVLVGLAGPVPEAQAKTVNQKTVVYLKFNGNVKDSKRKATVKSYGDIAYGKGKKGKAAYFDGNGDYLSLGRGLNLKGDYAFNVWVKPSKGNETRSDAALFAKYQTNHYGPYDFYLSYNRPAIWISNGYGGYTARICSTKLKNNKWYMLTYSYKASTGKVKIYVNGKLKGTFDVPRVTSNRDEVTVGRQSLMFTPYSNLQYKGWMDELRLFNDDLTASQVKSLYRKGK